MPTWLKRHGFSLVEVMIAAAVLATALLGIGLFQSATVKVNQKERDRSLAVQKAVQMMEEVLSYQVSSTGGQNGIDSLADAAGAYDFHLTIDKSVKPESSLSGNVPLGGGAYRLVRHIQVDPIPTQTTARRVTVSVYLGDGNSKPEPKLDSKGTILPAISSVVNIVKADAVKTQPTQVYDMYLIDIENMIGWWVDPNTLRTLMANTLAYMQANNPGLEIRPHWITRLSYGRDPYYDPIINKQYPASDLTHNPLDGVFFYIGMQAGGTVYYDPSMMDGQMLVDGVRTNPVDPLSDYDLQTNYTFADQFNNPVRYPEEEIKYANAVANTPAGKNPPEISLRMLYERMASQQIKNAIVVNLHGEMMPIPPSRPYSDAAHVPYYSHNNPLVKSNWGVDTTTLANDTTDVLSGARARLVTHPYRLYTNLPSDNHYADGKTVELRVFPYLNPIAGFQGSSNNGLDVEPPSAYRKAWIQIPGLGNWLQGGSNVNNVEVYVYHEVTNATNVSSDPVNGTAFNWDNGSGKKGKSPTPETTTAYHFVQIWPPKGGLDYSDYYGENNIFNAWTSDQWMNNQSSDHSTDLQSYYFATQPTLDKSGNFSMELQNIPYVHTQVSGQTSDCNSAHAYGVPPSRTLYGFNYFPDPYLLPLDFPNDSGAPRSTARFVIRFNLDNNCQTGSNAMTGPIEVETSIGDTATVAAPNRSLSWVWAGGIKPPNCETMQIAGDPRANPDRSARENGYYNHYFGNFSSQAYKTNAGDYAVPHGMFKNYDAVGYWPTYPNYNVFPNCSAGWPPTGGDLADIDLPHAGEIWRRALMHSNSEYLNPAGFSFYYWSDGGELDGPSGGFSMQPFTGSVTNGNVDDIIGQSYLITTAAKDWYAKPWLGELCPDAQWDGSVAGGYFNTGNLPSTGFRWTPHTSVSAWAATESNECGSGTVINYSRNHRLGSYGCVNFFNGGQAGNSSNTFSHVFADGDTASLTSPNGDEVANSFKLFLGSGYPSARPYAINIGGGFTPDWNSSENTNWRTTLSWGLLSNGPAYYADSQAAYEAVAPIVMTRNWWDGAGFITINSCAPTVTSGTGPIARLAIAGAMQDFFDMANPGLNLGNNAIKLLPLTTIGQPSENAQLSGNSCTVKWSLTWNRWDGSAYDDYQFQNYGSTKYVPQMLYNVKYSADNGKTWLFIQDNKPAVAGVFDGNGSHIVTGTSCNWSLKALGHQQYLLRVEGYRTQGGTQDAYTGTHYVYHQIPVLY